MRLTLRTLLAYLDNTLDSQDAEALKLKLTESSFATQLVQRIRDSIGNQMLAAPSPDAVGPVEDANAISEYLDSTLSHEQVAEIERACLESDPHLAEAAACHQILTMVLGTPANVSPELRKRIYELPDRSIEEIAVADSFSSLAVPDEPSPVGPWADDVPTADATLTPQHSVEPVGVADSGVSDAPTRLREMGIAEDPLSPRAAVAKPSRAIAGSRPRSITDSEIYGGSIRPSRITPWLVSLAIAAVLLFALSQIFAPLLARNKNVADAASDDAYSAEIEVAETQLAETQVPADPSPVMIDTTPAVVQSNSVSASSPELAEESGIDPSAPPVPTDLAPTESPDSEQMPAGAGDVVDDDVAAPNPQLAAKPTDTDRASELDIPPPGATDLAAAESPLPPTSDPIAEPDSKRPGTADPVKIAKIISADALVATMDDQQWTSLQKDAPVETESVIVCAPTFRAEMVTDNQMLTTMIGPTRVRWQPDNADINLHVETGRVLLSPGEPESMIRLVLAGQPIAITFTDASHVAAVHVTHSRQPGFDPLVAENHTPIRTITAVQGTIKISGIDDADLGSGELETGQQWTMHGNEEPTVTDLEQLPAWVEPTDDSDLTLEANARKALLSLLSEGDQSLEIALREATSYRQSEVAALAGQTLLALHRGDVYFDGVGILNQPKQRAYWPDHFIALQNVINQGEESASNLRDSILRMDSANSAAIMRLLIGYSQQQLEDGGDEELVEMLDSPSMAVRVLALENLRQIKGTILYFRAEEDNAVRRTPGIKKWIARQKKGDIRWPQ